MGFKAFLQTQGFSTAHISEKNYVHWDKIFFNEMPDRLVSLVQDDEWNKVLGRISPTTGTLFLRFRLNTAVNYDVVDKAFAHFELNHQGKRDFIAANEWWDQIA